MKSPIVTMLFAAFLWSLYPILIAVGGDYIGAASFVMFINIFCGLSAFIFGFACIKNRRQVFKNICAVPKTLNIDQWGFLFVVGLVPTLYNFCFIISIGLTSKVGAAIIIEAWPILAIFLAPLLITKQWDRVGVKEFIAALIAMAGVVLIMVGDVRYDGDANGLGQIFSNDDNLKSIVGIIVAFMGSIFLALSVIFRAEVSNRLMDILGYSKEVAKGRGSRDNYVPFAFIGEGICRVLTMLPSAFLLFIFPNELHLSPMGIGISIFVGVLIFNVGSVAVTIALLRSSTSVINLLYYVSPILAVIWFYLAGMSDLTVLILIGGLLVILSNIMVLKRKKKQRMPIPKAGE